MYTAKSKMFLTSYADPTPGNQYLNCDNISTYMHAYVNLHLYTCTCMYHDIPEQVIMSSPNR